MRGSYEIHNRWALGDTCCLSALVRDIQQAYPGEFAVRVTGSYPSFWAHNPHVTPDFPQPGVTLKLDYQAGIKATNEGLKVHFLTWFHRDFERQTGIPVPVYQPRGEVWLAPEERAKRLVAGRYWVVVSGGKTDMTAKWWEFARWQQVVDQLAARGIGCVQAGADFRHDIHPRLERCPATIGLTDSIRDLFGLIHHADGVLCGITAAMHLAAALEKPCVVVAGGREAPHWEAYDHATPGAFLGAMPIRVPHRFLHTLGRLDCCRDRGCWAERVVPLERADLSNGRRLCKDVVPATPLALPRCMTLITPAEVVQAVQSYYDDGTLPDPSGPAPTLTVPAVVSVGNPRPKALAHEPGEDPRFGILDHPTLGGKITAFVLGWGPHPELLRGCVGSILASVPRGRLELRILLNQPGAESEAYARSLDACSVVDVDHGDRRKYPAMRAAFRDPAHPITTPYLVWFDDDTRVLDPLWLVRLAETILANHREGSRLYGAKFQHDLAPYAKPHHDPRAWFAAAPWWRGRDLRLRGRPATGPGGTVIDFVSGWFWALATELIAKADIPDARLLHNGGDVALGEQVHQAGFRVKAFNEGKKHVWCPSKAEGGRRGWSEAFPWCDPATRAAHVPGA